MNAGNGRLVSLAPLTASPCSPLEQIDAAAAAGFSAVSLRTLPVMTTDADVMADADLQSSIKDRLASTGLSVLDIEVARATAKLDVAALVPALEFAGEVGARRFAITSEAQGVYDAATEAGVIERIAELCEAAEEYGVGIMLEFMAYRSIATLRHAEAIVAAVGHPGLGITIDALHLYRSGGSAADVRAIPEDILACLQLCDAPETAPADLAREARSERLYPGEGDLPLQELVSAVPQSLPISIEVPSLENAALSPFERAARAAAALKALGVL